MRLGRMRRRWAVLLLCCCCLLGHCRGGLMVVADEVASLVSLKESFGDEYGHLDNWVASAISPCQWTGVQCDNFTNVVALNLSTLNLTGSVSDVVGSLKHLITLRLDSNNFTGALPQEISQLSNLKHLNVSNNVFSYSLPSNISNLSKLEVLDCYNNNMSGTLPPGIASLHNLRHLHLGGNYFEGSIPPEYGSIGRNLSYIALAGNSLTGIIPPELGNLTGLQEMYMGYYNVFDRGLPVELGYLTNLVRIDFSFCKLMGSIPPQLGNLTRLDSIFLQLNELTGPLPPELGSLRNLKSFDVSVNNLTGSVPISYCNLVSLELFNVFRNQLHGVLPEGLGFLPNLMVFQVWDNNFTGQLPPQLGISGNLTYFDSSHNQLSGGLPANLCFGNKLQILIVMENQLSGPIPDGIVDCGSLRYVRLGNNRFNGSIPSGMLSLPALSLLQLNDNSFTGPIPSVVTSLVLQILDLSHNQLNSSMPVNFGSLTGLETLDVSNNQLTGGIPSQICQIPGIYEIDLSGNYLSGEIPTTIGNCSLLARLDLSRNALVGEIPFTVVNLSVLGVLNLSRNNLSGEIPEEIGLIDSLTVVDFSYNNLSGPVPVLGEAEYYNESAYTGNPYLCGPNLSACSSVGSNPVKSAGRGRGLLAWLVGALFTAALIVLLVGMCCFFRKYRYYILRMFRKEGAVRPWKLTPFQRLDFTASEVVECLCEENIIGKGGAGTVYKGEMINGEMVAVKRLACEGGRGTSSHDHGFSAEIQTLGKIRHRNIVRLLGFCTNNEMNLLVYEYMPNGSLGEFLHGKKSGLLDWTTRYNIAVQAAFGLCYLHHDCSPLIVHRDVKSNNILLDSNLEAHVADFGLAKLFEDSGKSESMSSIAGSYGYIAPEYAYTLKVNEKSDIYSFGVVLMELLTGKRPIETDFGDGVDIVQWVRTKIAAKAGIMGILDPRICGTNVPTQEVMLVLRVALLCSSDQPADRPTMRDVVQMLRDVRPKARGGSISDSRELICEQKGTVESSDLLSF